ncbi:MAG: NAD(P)-dependent oxidoreductase [Finegoldia sp.]|nr:NAD(P)-dependent oxidoreductase [Finegoldia sp.]
MNRMQRELSKLEDNGKKIRLAIVGCGMMGSGLISQMSRIKAMIPSITIDRTLKKCRDALENSGVSKADIVEASSLEVAKKAIDDDKFVISSDTSLAYKLEKVDGVVDATGNPAFGADLAYEAIKNHKHVILLNVECDSVVGPILNDLAEKNKVVYTGSAGDEPGAIIELSDFANGLGFNLLAVGKGKNNPLDNYANEDSLREDALAKGLSPKMLTSFVDGTNTMIELTSVANSLGFTPDVVGGHGVKTNIKEIADVYKLKDQGGILNNYNIVDFAFGVAPGVFAIVTHDSKEVKDLMKYLSMGDGPNYVLYRPYHLTCLETPLSIYRAIVEKEPTIHPKYGQVSDTVTIAKRDIKKGQLIEGIGGKDVFGQIISHKVQMENNYLPLPLITEKTVAKEDIKKDSFITYDMVALDEDARITKLRRKQDELGL